MQEGCVWKKKSLRNNCKACSSFSREEVCTDGCLWNKNLETCSSCNDLTKEFPCRNNSCLWNNNACSSCHALNKKTECVNAKCAWPNKNRGCVTCEEVTSMNVCTAAGCKWEKTGKKCSANVKPYNAEEACIDSGGSWNSKAPVGYRCTKCSSVKNLDKCTRKAACFVGRENGKKSPKKCISCAGFTKPLMCADQDNCGWNNEDKKCQPCIAFTDSKKCVKKYKCAWDDRKGSGKCTSCTDIEKKSRCEDAPSCGWRNKKQKCVVKRLDFQDN